MKKSNTLYEYGRAIALPSGIDYENAHYSDIITLLRKNFFNFDYAMDAIIKEYFEESIIGKFLFLSTNFDTVGMFKIKLQMIVMQNAPRYNVIFNALTTDIEKSIETYYGTSTSKIKSESDNKSVGESNAKNESKTINKNSNMDLPQSAIELDPKYISSHQKGDNIALGEAENKEVNNSQGLSTSESDTITRGFNGGTRYQLSNNQAQTFDFMMKSVLNDFDILFTMYIER